MLWEVRIERAYVFVMRKPEAHVDCYLANFKIALAQVGGIVEGEVANDGEAE